jgi:hypothetical protein
MSATLGPRARRYEGTHGCVSYPRSQSAERCVLPSWSGMGTPSHTGLDGSRNHSAVLKERGVLETGRPFFMARLVLAPLPPSPRCPTCAPFEMLLQVRPAERIMGRMPILRFALTPLPCLFSDARRSPTTAAVRAARQRGGNSDSARRTRRLTYNGAKHQDRDTRRSALGSSLPRYAHTLADGASGSSVGRRFIRSRSTAPRSI